MSQLLALPSELITHIFDFIINATNLPVHQLLTLQFISNKISQQAFIQTYFENIWKLMLLQGIRQESDKEEFEKLEKSLRRHSYRRVYCILSAVRRALHGQQYSDIKYLPKSEYVEYKVVMFGGGGVGKSALTIQFVQGMFIPDYDPTIEDSYRKQVERDGKVLLDILDTAGGEEYSAMRDQYVREADVYIIVLSKDTTSEGDAGIFSYQVVRNRDDENVPIVFAINKIDLGDGFPMEYIHNAVKYSGAKNYSICKTSAKTGEGVTELFDEVIKKARIGNINTMEYIKDILSMDKAIIKQIINSHKKKKCIVL